MTIRRWLIRATADLLLMVRYFTAGLAGPKSNWIRAIEGRVARSGLVGQGVAIPARWAYVERLEPVFIADPRTSRPKLIGVVAGEWPGRSFRKIAYKSKGHFLRRPPAICADVDSLKQAEGYGAAWFEAWDPQHKRMYRCPMAFFKAKGKFVEVDRGVNPQRGVLMSWMAVIQDERTL
jgi:hypothetical protein